MWFIGVEVEQGTSAPPPKKNPGSAPSLASNLRKLRDTKKLYILTCVVYSRSSQSIKIGSNQVIFIY